MKTTKYYEGFQAILDKHPMMKWGAKERPLTVNEVLYMLREEDADANVSMPMNDNCWGSIPSVKHTFVPTSDLVKKVKSLEYDEEATKMSDILCLTIYTY